MKKQKTNKRQADKFFVVACDDDLLKLHQQKKKVKNVLLGGEVLMTYLNQKDDQGNSIGVVKQARRLADGNLVSRTKAHLDVYVPTPVIDELKAAGLLSSSYISCDFTLKWIMSQCRVNHTFTLYISYPLEYRVLVETYEVKDKKVTSYSMRQFPSNEMYLGQLLHISGHQDHPYFIASPVEVPSNIPSEVRDVSGSIFKGKGRRAVVGSTKNKSIGKYLAPGLVLAGAMMSFPAVNIIYNEKLIFSQEQFHRIINGIEDTYYSGGRQVSKLERQQYFLESLNKKEPKNTKITTSILSSVSELRHVQGISDPVLESIKLPSSIKGWDFEVVLQIGSVPSMNNSELSEFVAKNMAGFMSGELVAMGAPASIEGKSGRSAISLQYLGRLNEEVNNEY